MVSIFAHEITDDLTSLVKQLDAKIGKNSDSKMAGFVVFLTDDSDALEPKLKDLAEKEQLEHLPLTIYDGTAGPESYKVSGDAAVTVMMWKNFNVKVNHALKKGQLDKEKVAAILEDCAKILD